MAVHGREGYNLRSLAFLSQVPFRPQPSPKHIWGGPVSSFNRSDSSSTTNDPSACPACQSPSVTTTKKHPDANSYWRCERCGEVWNVGRRHDRPSGAAAWR
jgi:ribosomal protein L37AE/L43A